jgi:cytochrome c
MAHKFMSVVVGAVALVSVAAMAGDGEKLYKKKLCQTCHGEAGREPILDTYPKLAGQNAKYLYNQMKDIKSGKRKNGLSSAMKPMVANVSKEEMKAIAKYLAAVEP